MILRIVVAVLAVVFAFLLLPLLVQVLEIPVSGAVMQILKLCIAALAVLYVIRGRWPG